MISISIIVITLLLLYLAILVCKIEDSSSYRRVVPTIGTYLFFQNWAAINKKEKIEVLFK